MWWAGQRYKLSGLFLIQKMPPSKNIREFSIEVCDEPVQNLSQTSEMQKCLHIVGAERGSNNISFDSFRSNLNNNLYVYAINRGL